MPETRVTFKATYSSCLQLAISQIPDHIQTYLNKVIIGKRF